MSHDDTIRWYRQQGVSIADLAAMFNRGTIAIKAILGTDYTPAREGTYAVDARGQRTSPYAHLHPTWRTEYQDGQRVSQIAERHNVSPRTVRSGLGDLYDPERDRKRQPSPTCAQGHDMAIHGRPASNGGRYCRACRLARGRKSPVTT